jgi:hypothetical protein
MTRSTCFAIAVVLAVVGGVGMGSADDKSRPEKAGRGRLEGTWEHTFENAPEHRQVKIINQTHFVWVTYVRADGKPLLMGGGTYTFDGKTYKEKYEFGGPGLPAELVGKEQTFTAELDGDMWTHTGTLSNDFFVKEIWHLVRDGEVMPVVDGKPVRERVDPLHPAPHGEPTRLGVARGAQGERVDPLHPAPHGAAPGDPAKPLIPPPAPTPPTSPDRTEPPASSPPATGSRLHTGDHFSPKTAARLIPAKVLEVHAKDSPYAAISEPEVKIIDSRAFIVGKYVPDKDGTGPFAGSKMWFPLDKVTHLVEFDSIESARKADDVSGPLGGSANSGLGLPRP